MRRNALALAVTLSLLTSTSGCAMRRGDRMVAGGFGTAMAIGGGVLLSTADVTEDFNPDDSRNDSAFSGLGKGLLGGVLLVGGLAMVLGALTAHEPLPPPPAQ
jgi:hypothetical protein